MIVRTKSEFRVDKRENMRGGEGVIRFEHYFEKDEIKAPCRLCAKAVVPVGGSIGLHQHQNEDEVFIILKGRGLIDDGQTYRDVGPGDAILTLGDGYHGLKNTGDTDLEFIAVVMTYPDGAD